MPLIQLYKTFYLLVEGVSSFTHGCSRQGSVLSAANSCAVNMPLPGCASSSDGEWLHNVGHGLVRNVTLTDPLPEELGEQQAWQSPQSPFYAAQHPQQQQNLSCAAAAKHGSVVRPAQGLASAVAAQSTLTEPLMPRDGHADGAETAAADAAQLQGNTLCSSCLQPSCRDTMQQPSDQPSAKQRGEAEPSVSGIGPPLTGAFRLLRSGHVFSLSALNVFGVYIGFDQTHHR